MLESVRALLEGVIDYAGLFPPSGLTMPEAVANYARYLAGDHAWMLGRFIVPLSRLSEFETALVSHPPARKWHVSALTGANLASAIPAVLAFNAHVRDAVIDSLEARADSVGSIQAPVVDGFVTYFEIPADPDPAPLIHAIASAKCRAKIRTGGVEENLFPGIEDLARFIRRCDETKVPLKATAGLHHPVRGVHPLTDQPDSAACPMHGFLNVLLAAAFVWSGVSDEEMQTMLGEEDPNFSFSRKGIGWGGRWISTQQIRSARERLLISFGSCSFEEPLKDLKATQLL
jgi:hypothetical protein